jgi:hypothetical protein
MGAVPNPLSAADVLSRLSETLVVLQRGSRVRTKLI